MVATASTTGNDVVYSEELAAVALLAAVAVTGDQLLSYALALAWGELRRLCVKQGPGWTVGVLLFPLAFTPRFLPLARCPGWGHIARL